MKLKHFVALLLLGGGLGVFGLVKACKSDDPAPQAQTPPPRETNPQPATSTATATPPVPTEMASRVHDDETLRWRDKRIAGDKQKDVSKGKPYKINVYKDAGAAGVNRAKVDLDRDDKWDEKYTFDGAKVTLQIAPDDDEQYTLTYHWTGSGWAPEGAAPVGGPTRVEATEPGTNAKGIDLPARVHDGEVLAWRERTIGGDKQKDASAGKPYKVNVYKDAGSTTVNRAKVDLDRDDKWDEKFTFEGAKITLQRAPADDEQYTETYHWSGTGWTKQ